MLAVEPLMESSGGKVSLRSITPGSVPVTVSTRLTAIDVEEPLLLIVDGDGERVQAMAFLLVKGLQRAAHSHDQRGAKKSRSGLADHSKGSQECPNGDDPYQCLSPCKLHSYSPF